jgi:hypothetical protein
MEAFLNGMRRRNRPMTSPLQVGIDIPYPNPGPEKPLPTLV